MNPWIFIFFLIFVLGMSIVFAFYGTAVWINSLPEPPPRPMPLASQAPSPPAQDISENPMDAFFKIDASGNLTDLKDSSHKEFDEELKKGCGDIQKPCHDTKVVFLEDEVLKPYAKAPIDSVDDYEHSLVFKNEGDRAMTKETRDLLMSRYPMDWSTQPPSSAKFQSGLAAFKEKFENMTQNPGPTRVNIYNTVDGSNMTPPDSWADEQKEREILATYVPKKPQSLTTYDVEDAKELIQKIYDAKGVIPTFKQTGDNQFTVFGVRPKNEPIKYEDDMIPAQASSEAVKEAREDVIVVPTVASEYRAGLDPFFTPGEKTRDGKWDYTQWTPGLERMFAPNAPMKNWY